MSIGGKVKDAAANTSDLTDKVVNAVEDKVADIVDAVKDGVTAAAEGTKKVAGSSTAE